MGLMCMSRTQINYMLNATFLALVCQGILFARIPDRWGNRKTMLVFGSINLFAQFMCLLNPNYHIRIFAFFIIGLTFIKASQSYTWLSGLVQQKYVPLCYGLVNTYDCMVLLVLCLYFMHVSRDYFYIYFYVGSFVGAVAHCLMVAFAPESPKFLIGR